MTSYTKEQQLAKRRAAHQIRLHFRFPLDDADMREDTNDLVFVENEMDDEEEWDDFICLGGLQEYGINVPKDATGVVLHVTGNYECCFDNDFPTELEGYVLADGFMILPSCDGSSAYTHSMSYGALVKWLSKVCGIDVGYEFHAYFQWKIGEEWNG